MGLLDLATDAIDTVIGKNKKLTEDPNANAMTIAQATQGYEESKKQKQAVLDQNQTYAKQMQDIAAKRAGYAQNIGTQYDKATQAGVGQLRSNVARSLAAGQAAGAGDDAGQNYGALLQAGVSGGQAIGNYVAQQGTAREQAVQQAQGLADQAQVGAAEAGVNTAENARKLGTTEDDRNALRAQAETVVSQAVAKHTHFYGNDRKAMANEVRTYAATVGDPVVRAELMKRADDLENNTGAGVTS